MIKTISIEAKKLTDKIHIFQPLYNYLNIFCYSMGFRDYLLL